MKSVRLTIRLNTLRQRIPLIVHAIIDAGVSFDLKIDHYCGRLAQLVNDEREQSLAREFFHLDLNE